MMVDGLLCGNHESWQLVFLQKLDERSDRSEPCQLDHCISEMGGFRLYVVRVDTYTVWSQWWSVEECLDLMA